MTNKQWIRKFFRVDWIEMGVFVYECVYCGREFEGDTTWKELQQHCKEDHQKSCKDWAPIN